MRYFSLLIVFIFWSAGYAQVDQPTPDTSGHHIDRETHHIGRESHHSGKIKLGKSFSPHTPNLPLIGKPKSLSLDVNKKSNKVNIRPKQEFVSPHKNFNPGYLNKYRKEGNGKGGSTKPQDLGRYYASGDHVRVSWRDSQVVDGDRVDIIVNGKVVVHNVTLLAQYHSILVDLKKGFTKIAFRALNQGESGPNTADFKIEDQTGTVLTHGQWNLSTGTKAHLVIIKN